MANKNQKENVYYCCVQAHSLNVVLKHFRKKDKGGARKEVKQLKDIAI